MEELNTIGSAAVNFGRILLLFFLALHYWCSFWSFGCVLKTRFAVQSRPGVPEFFLQRKKEVPKNFLFYFIATFDVVDLGRIELPSRQCECRVLPLNHRPPIHALKLQSGSILRLF